MAIWIPENDTVVSDNDALLTGWEAASKVWERYAASIGAAKVNGTMELSYPKLWKLIVVCVYRNTHFLCLGSDSVRTCFLLRIDLKTGNRSPNQQD